MNTRLEPILNAYRFGERYACALCEGVGVDVESVGAGKGLEHHPVWIIGHLATGSSLLAKNLGVAPTMPALYDELFLRKGPSDRRLPNADAAYPGLEGVLGEYRRQHGIVEGALRDLDDAALSKEVAWRLGPHLPRMIDLITFMCVSHEALHLGQFADWRRAMGLPGAMAGM